MPVPAHRRLTFRGIFGSLVAPYEEWSFRINFGFDGSAEDDAALLAAAAPAFATHLAPKVKANVRLTEVKVANIAAGTPAQPQGVYASDALIAEVDVPGTGSGTAPAYPPQVAYAISLNTNTRGASGRGRFYLPQPAVAISDIDGLVAATNAQGYATSAAAFLAALDNQPSWGVPSVVSTKGTASPITSVRVGRALDTIRSRRRQIDESYGADVAI